MTQAVVLAHSEEPHSIDTPRALSPWDVGVIGCLAVIGLLYLLGSLRLARRGAASRRFEHVAFGIGWSALVFAVLPPLDSLSIQLFSVHMVQHELMMLVGAPLLIAGRPLPRCLSGLPERARVAAAHALQGRIASKTWRVITAPLVAWAFHGLAIWIWHMPALYDAAVGNEGIHTLQHATFVGTSALFWWGMLYGRYGRAGYGAAVFYVFTTVIHTGILGAMVTFAGTLLYPIYAAPAAARGIDPLADQQLAGLLMWIPACFVLTLLGLALFAAWLGESARRESATRTANAKCKMQTLTGGTAS
jgi:cytochrome c oxidase assembly factor CtaG